MMDRTNQISICTGMENVNGRMNYQYLEMSRITLHIHMLYVHMEKECLSLLVRSRSINHLIIIFFIHPTRDHRGERGCWTKDTTQQQRGGGGKVEVEGDGKAKCKLQMQIDGTQAQQSRKAQEGLWNMDMEMDVDEYEPRRTTTEGGSISIREGGQISTNKNGKRVMQIGKKGRKFVFSRGFNNETVG
jgi:hypothetical protein